jgi:hypothetical protein
LQISQERIDPKFKFTLYFIFTWEDAMQNSELKFTTVEIQTIGDSLEDGSRLNNENYPKEHPMACCCCACCAVVDMPTKD